MCNSAARIKSTRAESDARLAVLAYSKQTKKRLHQLAEKQPPQVTVHAKPGDCQKYEKQSDQQTSHAEEKGKGGFAQPV